MTSVFGFGFPLHVPPSSASSPLKRAGHATLCRSTITSFPFPPPTIPSTPIIKTRLTTSWGSHPHRLAMAAASTLHHHHHHGTQEPSQHTRCAALLPYRYRYCFTTRKHVAAASTLH
ncbi:hypothetical protein EDB86DRAFT_3095204 [Lactarius hatsudake]|nr:hypothetical protein EDB86DRAFT_3095204 [Lactarius hatsudake]